MTDIEIAEDMFLLKIWRGTPDHQYWETFALKREPSLNVISALMEIQKRPINVQGEQVTPVAWEQGCLEEVCGSCSMLINGIPRQACTALIETIIAETKKRTITLAPFTKFPLIRDLVVDRHVLFDGLKKTSAWVEVDDSRDRGFGPKIPSRKQEVMYTLSTCMTCGCCVEACPQFNSQSDFVGPQVVSQVRLFNLHPIGREQKISRLRTMMERGGISECGNAQNCVKVCPKKIPLTDSIAVVGREVTLQALRTLFSMPERDDT